jgi:hypothetical protein
MSVHTYPRLSGNDITDGRPIDPIVGGDGFLRLSCSTSGADHGYVRLGELGMPDSASVGYTVPLDSLASVSRPIAPRQMPRGETDAAVARVESEGVISRTGSAVQLQNDVRNEHSLPLSQAAHRRVPVHQGAVREWPVAAVLSLGRCNRAHPALDFAGTRSPSERVAVTPPADVVRVTPPSSALRPVTVSKDACGHASHSKGWFQ